MIMSPQSKLGFSLQNTEVAIAKNRHERQMEAISENLS